MKPAKGIASQTGVACFARGAYGDLVGVLQAGLARQGHYTRATDNDFGGGTELAVRSLQIESRLPVTGRADPVTWHKATGLDWPTLFERCLQLTARFEGHGYRLVAGNFDGAGLTFGIIGFTLQHGEVRAIINEISARAPEILQQAFGSQAAWLMRTFQTSSLAELLKWADSISGGIRRQRVKEPWRSGFSQLGAQPLVQEIQRRIARERYFDSAVATAARLHLRGDTGVALCFDIHVQNGGVKPKDEVSYQKAAARMRQKESALARRELLAGLVAASARKAYREDVLSRKQTIATGSGVVHGALFALDAWGLSTV